MIGERKGRTVPVTESMIWAAYKQVKRKKGSAGVDKKSIKKFDGDMSKNLYKIFNRMSSGSYFAPPVKEVEIPKDGGKVRKLGIPTVSDRIAQTVVKNYLEERMEQLFTESSYGYRPLKSQHDAIEAVKKNCKDTAWVIDMDIQGFFDEIDHELLWKAIDQKVPEKWVKMYVKRWLEAPVQEKDGKLRQNKGKGTPQGGVISPMLANLYLHYALDITR